jgi:hypothetical protein
MLVSLVAVPPVLTIEAAFVLDRTNHPTVDELASNLLSHEVVFDRLVTMLDVDRRLLPAEGQEVYDLRLLSAVVRDPARVSLYRDLLQQISVSDLAYWPKSGSLMLSLNAGNTGTLGTSKSYLYLPGGRPSPLEASYHADHWRGPGISVLSGDRRVKGDWYVHYDRTVVFGAAPY